MVIFTQLHRGLLPARSSPLKFAYKQPFAKKIKPVQAMQFIKERFMVSHQPPTSLMQVMKDDTKEKSYSNVPHTECSRH